MRDPVVLFLLIKARSLFVPPFHRWTAFHVFTIRGNGAGAPRSNPSVLKSSSMSGQ